MSNDDLIVGECFVLEDGLIVLNESERQYYLRDGIANILFDEAKDGALITNKDYDIAASKIYNYISKYCEMTSKNET